MECMREKDIERKLVRAVRESGGLALKFVSPGMAGVPDRLLLFPGGRVAFAEVKAPGEKPRPLQVHRIEQLRALGFFVYVVDSPGKIEEILSSVILNEVKDLPRNGKRQLIKMVCEGGLEDDHIALQEEDGI